MARNISAQKRRKEASKRREDKKDAKKPKKVRKSTKSKPEAETTTMELVQEGEYYLQCWMNRNDPELNEKNPWRFKKAKQVWLTRWMYRPDIVKKSTFKILLEYLKDMKGQAKDRLLQEAQAITEAGEPELPQEPEDGKENPEQIALKMARRKYKRALQVAQSIS